MDPSAARGEAGEREALRALARELPVLGALARVARRAMRRAAGLPMLPDAQIEVLRVVEGSPGISTGGVADRLQLVPNTVSTLVGELVGAGLLTRERDPADRRVARLRLTAEAVEVLRRWNAVRDEVVADALARLREADRRALVDVLPAARRLLAVLDTLPDVGSARSAAEAPASRSGTTTGQQPAGSGTTTDSAP